MNERAAVIASYCMARFNSNLGCTTATAAFDLIEKKTGIPAGTVKTGMRDSFDYYFPWRKGWDLGESETKKMWEHYGLEDVFFTLNKFSEKELVAILIALDIWIL